MKAASRQERTAINGNHKENVHSCMPYCCNTSTAASRRVRYTPTLSSTQSLGPSNAACGSQVTVAFVCLFVRRELRCDRARPDTHALPRHPAVQTVRRRKQTPPAPLQPRQQALALPSCTRHGNRSWSSSEEGQHGSVSMCVGGCQHPCMQDLGNATNVNDTVQGDGGYWVAVRQWVGHPIIGVGTVPGTHKGMSTGGKQPAVSNTNTYERQLREGQGSSNTKSP